MLVFPSSLKPFSHLCWTAPRACKEWSYSGGPPSFGCDGGGKDDRRFRGESPWGRAALPLPVACFSGSGFGILPGGALPAGISEFTLFEKSAASALPSVRASGERPGLKCVFPDDRSSSWRVLFSWFFAGPSQPWLTPPLFPARTLTGSSPGRLARQGVRPFLPVTCSRGLWGRPVPWGPAPAVRSSTSPGSGPPAATSGSSPCRRPCP